MRRRRARRGTWFDPELVDAVADLERDVAFWASIEHPDVQADAIQRLVRRAGLLHDVGKLGISNQILDKPTRLTDQEWRAVRHHPRLSLVIRRRVPALADVAQLAAMHHERLDSSGYPYGLVDDD